MGATLIRAIFLGAALIGLSACGFQPVYGDMTTAQGAQIYEAIELQIPKSRVGQLVYRHISEDLNPNGDPVDAPYRLAVRLRTTTDGLAFEQDSTETRYNYTLSADFDIVDKKTNKPIHTGTTFAVASYNFTSSRYGTYVAREDAEGRAAEVVSENISLRVAAYFRAQRSS